MKGILAVQSNMDNAQLTQANLLFLQLGGEYVLSKTKNNKKKIFIWQRKCFEVVYVCKPHSV